MCPERADLVWPVLLVLGIPAVLSGQCFLFDYQFKAMHRFVLFLFCLVVTMSSNQVGRTDLTPIALAEFVFLMLSLRRL